MPGITNQFRRHMREVVLGVERLSISMRVLMLTDTARKGRSVKLVCACVRTTSVVLWWGGAAHE